MAADPAPGATCVVWPRWQRSLHWLLAATVLVGLVTHEGGRVHELVGYAALAAAVLRLVIGFAGPAHARFTAFVRAPATTWAYAKAVFARREARHLNHNPLGAWMVVALVGLGVLAGGSGALYVTDRFWGEAWVIGFRAVTAWAFEVLVPLHVAGGTRPGGDRAARGRRNGATARPCGWLSTRGQPAAPIPRTFAGRGRQEVQSMRLPEHAHLKAARVVRCRPVLGGEVPR